MPARSRRVCVTALTVGRHAVAPSHLQVCGTSLTLVHRHVISVSPRRRRGSSPRTGAILLGIAVMMNE
eukprot:6125172-Prymnesium_polylepis.1